jgi:glycosyltransferase involved in cell wall biosynthesis
MNKTICFVGMDNYPVLNTSLVQEYIGGESVQQNLLAMAFKNLGFEVSMVVKDHGQKNGETRNGIRVYKTFEQSRGLPVFRFIYPRLSSILKALKDADSHIYYQSCAGMMTGVVAWFCKRHNRKFIFRTAHDTDCIRGKQLIRFWRDKKLYEYGIKRTNLVAVQGYKQQKLLKENYNLNSVPVNMAVEIPEQNNFQNKDIDILWVNNMRTFKRPELVIELAKKLNQYRFLMIGGPCAGLGSYYRKIEQKAKEAENLNFIGPVPYHKVNHYFLKAKLFVNTSHTEGFPNSFLQAWVRGVPVISFFDPDGLIAANKLGYVPSNLDEMKESIDALLNDDSKRVEFGQKAKNFAIENYSPDSVVKEYIKLLGEF